MIEKSLLFFLRISRLCLLNTPQAGLWALILGGGPLIWTAVFRFDGPPLLHQRGCSDVMHSTDVECGVCESALFSMQHGSFELSHSQTRVLHNLWAAFTHCILQLLGVWRHCVLSGVVVADRWIGELQFELAVFFSRLGLVVSLGECLANMVSGSGEGMKVIFWS